MFADGQWVATGGGGYAVVEVVPRSWTLLMAELSGQPLPPSTAVPQSWRTYAGELTQRVPPQSMTDGRTPIVRTWESGYDPEDPIDRTILTTRRAVFAHHGLDPERD